MQLYNSSAIAFLATQFFRSLNVSLYDRALAPQPGHKRLRSELVRRAAATTTQLATLTGTEVQSPLRKAFYTACEQANGGWCPQVNASATWTSKSGVRFELDGLFGMCFPFSCCDGSGCDMNGGLSAVVVTGVTSVINRWCGGGSQCPSRTVASAAPLMGAAVSGGSVGALLRSGALGGDGRAALAALSGSDEPFLDEERRAAAGEPALWGGTTDLRVRVTNFCLASVFDTLMYVALGAAVILCFCGCLVVAQRACTLRRAAALDLAARYDDFQEDEDAIREREARVARRKARAEALAFEFGSRPLQPPSSSLAPTTSSGSSGKRPEPKAKGSQASESLLAAAEAEGADDSTAVEPVAAPDSGEAPTDPISLETIRDGDDVVQFPVCAHLFHLATLQQWLTTHDTCPVCRRAFPDTPAAGGAPLGADAKATGGAV